MICPLERVARPRPGIALIGDKALQQHQGLRLAVGIATRAKWSKTIEIIVLTLACYGTVIFVLPDFFDGCLNMQPIGVKECSPAFTPYYAFYVYFGLGINIIWLCVPLGMLIVNVRRDFGFKGM